ncbi:hypothetical protein HRG_013119 [Hirsutella rhossiliensis]
MAIGDFANIPVPTLYRTSQLLDQPYEDYSAPVFWNMTFPPNHTAQQYQGGLDQVHTDIMTSPLLPTVDRSRSMQNNGVEFQDEAAGYQEQ